MELARMSEVENGDYTPFGVTADRLMADRQIRTPTELDRRIKAEGGYPRRISPQTIINYFKGEHNVPWEFLQYFVVVLNSVKALTDDELEELGHNYAWRQRGSGVSAVTVDSARRAQEYIKMVEARKHARKE